MTMESNGLMFSSGMDSGMLGLEMSLQHHLPPPPNPKTPKTHLQNQQQSQMVTFGHQETEPTPQNQQVVKQGFPFITKSRNQQLTFSDEDDSAGVVTADQENNNLVNGQRKNTPWQRMKWTDEMVRHLVMAVFYIGDDQAGSENDPASKKKPGGGSGVVLQKKGKWKSVSQAMIGRGFFVSPQQCEDKFNDLNKRYKRVNDILGKGTACKVVENQKLLETMDHLSPKLMEEVKKLLNSKHLYFREMCAYHNTCAKGAQQSAKVEKMCLHSVDNGSTLPKDTTHLKGPKEMKWGSSEEDEDEDEDSEDEEEVDEIIARDREYCHTSSKKRRREGSMFNSALDVIEELKYELKNVEEDVRKGWLQKRQWMRLKLMELEEQQMNYKCQALELEKERLKWLKFRNKKERDMEAENILNEQMRLQSERMLLLLQQKELELLHCQMQNQSCNMRADSSSIRG